MRNPDIVNGDYHIHWLEHFLADGGGLHAFDEFANNLEVHVGGKEGSAHFLECVRHVFLGQLSDAAEVA